MNWLRKLEAKLDEYGRPAWIAAMVVGFVVFWPIGLATLGYMMWSGRMGCWRRHRGEGPRSWRRRGSTGNTAFDAYREEVLNRLEDEREAFTTFLDRLRKAKDQAEFDQFMNEKNQSGGGTGGGEAGPAGPGFQPAG